MGETDKKQPFHLELCAHDYQKIGEISFSSQNKEWITCRVINEDIVNDIKDSKDCIEKKINDYREGILKENADKLNWDNISTIFKQVKTHIITQDLRRNILKNIVEKIVFNELKIIDKEFIEFISEKHNIGNESSLSDFKEILKNIIKSKYKNIIKNGITVKEVNELVDLTIKLKSDQSLGENSDISTIIENYCKINDASVVSAIKKKFNDINALDLEYISNIKDLLKDFTITDDLLVSIVREILEKNKVLPNVSDEELSATKKLNKNSLSQICEKIEVSVEADKDTIVKPLKIMLNEASYRFKTEQYECSFDSEKKGLDRIIKNGIKIKKSSPPKDITGIQFKEIEEDLKKEGRFVIIQKVFKEVVKKERENEIYIGKSIIREKEKIGVLMKDGVYPESRLNGVIGALTVCLDIENSKAGDEISYQITSENVKKVCENWYRKKFEEENKKEKISVQKFVEKYPEYSEYIKISDKNEIVIREDIIIPETTYNLTLNKELKAKENLSVNLRIDSRFDSKSEDQNNKSFFAATMLTYGNIGHINVDQVICDNNNLFDCLLVAVLSQALEKAYYKGIYKTYRQFESNNEKLKGSIDIARHIKLNAGMNNGKIACRFRENTVNNYLNILIYKTYEYAKLRYPEVTKSRIENNARLRPLFDTLRYEVDAYSIPLKTVISKNMDPIAHPFFSEYELVRKTCLKLLRGEGVSIFEDSNNTVNGFLYYLPDLWEDYLNKVFDKALYWVDENGDRCLKDLYTDSQATQGYISNISNEKNENPFLCVARPDFVFYELGDNKNRKNKLILDAKMKPAAYGFFAGEECSGDIRGTLVSDVDKCLRDMLVFNAEKGTGVVFPKETTESVHIRNKKALEPEYYTYEELLTRINDEYGIPREDKEAPNEDNNKSKKGIPEDYFKREINDFIKDKNFYSLPFVVPNSGEFENYREWKKVFDYSEEKFVSYVMMEKVFGKIPKK